MSNQATDPDVEHDVKSGRLTVRRDGHEVLVR